MINRIFSSYLNWGGAWRISTIMTGVIMLLLAPSTLNSKDLSLFYAIYAAYAAIAIFDFGLTNAIFVTGYINLSKNQKRSLKSQIIARLSLISFTFFIYGYLLLSKDNSVNLWANIFLFLLSALFQYASLLYLSYTEGNIDNKLAYTLRTLGEITGCAILGFCLINNLGYLSIYSLLIARSLPALISFILIKKIIECNRGNLECENYFTSKLGVVMALGYMTSTGLINIIHWMYDESTSAAFSQMYLIQSTLFSICMTTFLYKQKLVKDSLVQNSMGEIISIKSVNTKSIQIVFSLISALVLLVTEMLKQFNYDVVKFGASSFIMLYIFNLFLINNHVISIIFRMRGIEGTFSLSMLAGLSILGSVFLSGYYQSIVLFLYCMVGISIIINKYMTDRIFTKNIIMN